jgi:hypothetical protein
MENENFKNFEIEFQNKNPDALLQLFLKIKEDKLDHFDLVTNLSFEIFIKEFNQNVLINSIKTISFDKNIISNIDIKCNYKLQEKKEENAILPSTSCIPVLKSFRTNQANDIIPDKEYISDDSESENEEEDEKKSTVYFLDDDDFQLQTINEDEETFFLDENDFAKTPLKKKKKKKDDNILEELSKLIKRVNKVKKKIKNNQSHLSVANLVHNDINSLQNELCKCEEKEKKEEEIIPEIIKKEEDPIYLKEFENFKKINNFTNLSDEILMNIFKYDYKKKDEKKGPINYRYEINSDNYSVQSSSSNNSNEENLIKKKYKINCKSNHKIANKTKEKIEKDILSLTQQNNSSSNNDYPMMRLSISEGLEKNSFEEKLYHHLKLISDENKENIKNNIIFYLTEMMKFIDNFDLTGEEKKKKILLALQQYLFDSDVDKEFEYILKVVCPELIDILISVDTGKIKIAKKLCSSCLPI